MADTEWEAELAETDLVRLRAGGRLHLRSPGGRVTACQVAVPRGTEAASGGRLCVGCKQTVRGYVGVAGGTARLRMGGGKHPRRVRW